MKTPVCTAWQGLAFGTTFGGTILGVGQVGRLAAVGPTIGGVQLHPHAAKAEMHQCNSLKLVGVENTRRHLGAAATRGVRF